MNHYLESCPFSLNTTRICNDTSIGTSIEVSRVGFTNMKPNTVVLVNENEIFDGIAATSLVHFPINAPILFTNGHSLNKETLKEIKRLSPNGYKGIHVILVGNISKNVSLELNNYGFKTHHVCGRNHYETACMIPHLRKEFKNILIISGKDYSEGIIAGYWSAHHGDPILYVQKNRIPHCTLETIKNLDDINVYIIGSTKTVSEEVENSLSKLDNVKHIGRIDGETPYDICVNFAKYKDSETEFGWDRNYKAGHAFTFGNLKYPMKIIAGVLFAHMGKHTPAILTRKDTIPDVVKRYISAVKPMPTKNMPRPPFMHGFILGSTENIGYHIQSMIENLLSIDHEMMSMDHNEMMKMHHCGMMDMDNDEMMKMHHCGMMDMDHDDKMKMHHCKMVDMDHDDKMKMHHCGMMDMDHDDEMKMHHCGMIDMNHDDEMKMHHCGMMDMNHDDKMKMHHCKMMDMDNDKMMKMHHGEMMDMDHDDKMKMHHCKMMDMDNDEMMKMHHCGMIDMDDDKMMKMHHCKMMDMDNDEMMKMHHCGMIDMDDDKMMKMHHCKMMDMNHDDEMKMHHGEIMDMDHDDKMKMHHGEMNMDHDDKMKMHHGEMMKMHHCGMMNMDHDKMMKMHHGEMMDMNHDDKMKMHHCKMMNMKYEDNIQNSTNKMNEEDMNEQLGSHFIMVDIEKIIN